MATEEWAWLRKLAREQGRKARELTDAREAFMTGWLEGWSDEAEEPTSTLLVGESGPEIYTEEPPAGVDVAYDSDGDGWFRRPLFPDKWTMVGGDVGRASDPNVGERFSDISEAYGPMRSKP